MLINFQLDDRGPRKVHALLIEFTHDITIECLTTYGEVPADEVREHRLVSQPPCRSGASTLSILKSDTLGGKAMRLEVINIVSRVDRSAYNIVRLNGMWHHVRTTRTSFSITAPFL